MENKILELLERKGSVSMNDDIFPLVELNVCLLSLETTKRAF